MNVFKKAAATLLMLSAVAVAHAGPPQIPHPIDAYKIVEGQPQPCRMCHQLATATPGQKTQIPQSHQKNGDLAQERFNCLMCHQVKK